VNPLYFSGALLLANRPTAGLLAWRWPVHRPAVVSLGVARDGDADVLGRPVRGPQVAAGRGGSAQRVMAPPSRNALSPPANCS
jgi:hypothetical protein